MTERRELRLVQQGSPCDTNYFDRSLLTIEQALQRGKETCPNYDGCVRHPRNCALRYGTMVAKFVMQGGDLKTELVEYSQESHTNEQYWDSVDRINFELMKGKSNNIRAVERFAKLVLKDTSESVFESCPKCEGVKLETTDIDSGRDGVSSLSGSGRTRKRFVAYCPNCDPKPQGGTFEESLIEDLI